MSTLISIIYYFRIKVICTIIKYNIKWVSKLCFMYFLIMSTSHIKSDLLVIRYIRLSIICLNWVRSTFLSLFCFDSLVLCITGLHTILLWFIPNLSSISLAYLCRQMDIPSLSYRILTPIKGVVFPKSMMSKMLSMDYLKTLIILMLFPVKIRSYR